MDIRNLSPTRTGVAGVRSRCVWRPPSNRTCSEFVWTGGVAAIVLFIKTTPQSRGRDWWRPTNWRICTAREHCWPAAISVRDTRVGLRAAGRARLRFNRTSATLLVLQRNRRNYTPRRRLCVSIACHVDTAYRYIENKYTCDLQCWCSRRWYSGLLCHHNNFYKGIPRRFLCRFSLISLIIVFKITVLHFNILFYYRRWYMKFCNCDFRHYTWV